MAVRDANGLYRGTIGNLLFRVVNGKQIVQSKALSITHSVGTKRSSKTFGLCSSQATQIRGKLKPWMDGYCDTKVSHRFLGACIRGVKSEINKHLEEPNVVHANMKDLEGFEFNSAAPLSKCFWGGISVLGEPHEGLEIKIASFIPKKDVRYPVQCQNVEFKLIVFHSSLGVNSADVLEQQQWVVEKNKEVEEEKSIRIAPITTQGITLVLVQLLYFKNKSKLGKVYLNDSDVHAMQVVYAR